MYISVLPGLMYINTYLKVPQVLAVARRAALREAIAVKLRDQPARHARSQVQTVHVLAAHVRDLASTHQTH